MKYYPLRVARSYDHFHKHLNHSNKQRGQCTQLITNKNKKKYTSNYSADKLIGKCSTCYLVVDHNMNSAICGVGWEVTKMKRLINHSLSCKGSIPM